MRVAASAPAMGRRGGSLSGVRAVGVRFRSRSAPMPEPRRDHAQASRELEDRLGHPEMPERWASGLWPVDREHALVIAQHRVLLASIEGQDRHLPAVEFARYVTMLRAHYRSEEALQ